MTAPPQSREPNRSEHARADVELLMVLRKRIASRLEDFEPPGQAAHERTLRYQRLVALLDNRIRVAGLGLESDVA